MEILYFWLGLSIAFTSFKGIHKEWKSMTLVIVIQLIIVPLIGIWYSSDLPPGDDRNVMLILAISPGGVTSAIAARLMKLNLTLNVAFTSLTALVYMFIVQPFIVPLMLDGIQLNGGSIFTLFLSVLALSSGMAMNYFMPEISRWLDKILAICILGFVVFHILKEVKGLEAVQISMVWLLIKFHFTIVIISAVLSSLFFGLNRAPLIVLETGFANTSLVAAMVISLGWPPLLPMVYGIVMFLSAAIMAVNVWMINRWKPKMYLTNMVLKPYRGMAIPPFGIFIRPRCNNLTVIKHELIHCRQYKDLGFMGFYLQYAWQMLRYGYDKAPLEIEARIESGEVQENLKEYSKKIHGKEPISSNVRILVFVLVVASLMSLLSLINHQV